KKFIKKEKIDSGVIFVNQKGKPISRCLIWEKMKRICRKININPKKVYPHNLRKLFARTFYKVEKDIAKLADILGHSSIDTTRIYIISTGKEHQKKIERLNLVISEQKNPLT
ncbi:tyrosine-type recombinase/integrase, partial [Floccifex sp.]|uniref:tyrosine-type recombinase/integrase n=1 Tax=Floccifex sp. TaxID=2815810 RepID=UPI003F030299